MWRLKDCYFPPRAVRIELAVVDEVVSSICAIAANDGHCTLSYSLNSWSFLIQQLVFERPLRFPDCPACPATGKTLGSSLAGFGDDDTRLPGPPPPYNNKSQDSSGDNVRFLNLLRSALLKIVRIRRQEYRASSNG